MPDLRNRAKKILPGPVRKGQRRDTKERQPGIQQIFNVIQASELSSENRTQGFAISQ